MTAPFWSVPQGDLFGRLDSSPEGLTSGVAKQRLGEVGPNRLHDRPRARTAWLLVRQFASPIVLLLIAAALLSWLVHDSTDARVILGIVIASGLLGFWQEHDAANTVDKLLAVVELKTTVVRDGRPVRMAIESVVPGDVVELSAGSGIPADCRLLSSHDLFVNEATLTGETYPVEKLPVDLPADTPLARRTNCTRVKPSSGQAGFSSR